MFRNTMPSAARAVAVLLLGFATACDRNPAAPQSSTALSGSMQMFATRGDDYAYTAVLMLTAGDVAATVTNVRLSVTTTPTPLVTEVAAPSDGAVAAGTYKELRLSVANSGGRAYPSIATAVVTYTDALGRSGTLSLDATVPSCVVFTYAARCSPSTLPLGNSASCSGFLEYGCQPMYFPINGSEISWTAASPGIVSFSGGVMTAIGRGTTTITGAYSGQTSTSTIVVQ